MTKWLMMVAAAIIAATSLQAQTERSDNFRAKYEAMAEYDAIEDIPTAVSATSRTVTTGEERSYTLNGTPANASTRGLVISNGKKIIRK